jgi:hypothetical protein
MTTASQQGLWDKGYVGSSMIRPQQVNKGFGIRAMLGAVLYDHNKSTRTLG